MKVTPEIVKHVAALARLELSQEELEQYTSQLDKILEYMKQLDGLDTEPVSGTSHGIELFCPTRDDLPTPQKNHQILLDRAPEKHQGHFKVPRIIE